MFIGRRRPHVSALSMIYSIRHFRLLDTLRTTRLAVVGGFYGMILHFTNNATCGLSYGLLETSVQKPKSNRGSSCTLAPFSMTYQAAVISFSAMFCFFGARLSSRCPLGGDGIFQPGQLCLTSFQGAQRPCGMIMIDTQSQPE
jgi:hypothetical protein